VLQVLIKLGTKLKLEATLKIKLGIRLKLEPITNLKPNFKF